MAKKKKIKPAVAASTKTGARRMRTAKRGGRRASRPAGTGVRSIEGFNWPAPGNLDALFGSIPGLKGFDHVKETRKMRDEWGR